VTMRYLPKEAAIAQQEMVDYFRARVK
jgi:hypothetical protein